MSQRAFEGAIILVTGGTSGIGLACAERFARGGAHVVVVGRDRARGDGAERHLRDRGASCEFVAGDLSDRAQLRAVFDRVASRYGRLTIAVNNAGTDGASFTPLLEYPEDAWDAVLALNVTAVWLCMKAELALMRGQSGCSIVNVASLAGLKASYSGGCAYTASKHAVIGLTKSAAVDASARGVRINAVCPGLVRTPMADAVLGDRLDSIAAKNPLGRTCDSDEVAAVIEWLCSRAASFVNGVALPVDGGILAA